ncbi:trypsin-like peptidase domain-containing protein [bacterium]|nr:MAG: trypsin-like peptidase domain-containing protein [bacterium]
MENNTNTTNPNNVEPVLNSVSSTIESSAREPATPEPAASDTKKIVITSLITALITTLVVGYVFNPSQNNRTSVRTVSESENAVVDAVEAANPAVVAITISKNVPTYERFYQNIPGPFGGFQIPQLRQNGTELQEIGGGSGFLVSSDGYIVTNKHVVADTTAQYTVFTNDGKKYEAKVIDRDPVQDLAVMKIDGNNFPSLNFADSDQVKLGQTVIAIGNALAEFRNTVSLGIVSGLSRSITASDGRGNSESLDQLIQTDAGINSGNSGGPLLNLSGEVIGVNVAVANGANSIGFALSSNSVKNIVESVKTNGKIIRPYLGVRYTEINKELQEQNNLSVDYGVLVTGGRTESELAVLPGSPADKAGIVANDIILEIDGQKIDEGNRLPSIMSKKKVGDRVTLKLLSKGSEKMITVILEEMKL